MKCVDELLLRGVRIPAPGAVEIGEGVDRGVSRRG